VPASPRWGARCDDGANSLPLSARMRRGIERPRWIEIVRRAINEQQCVGLLSAAQRSCSRP
jgi:hypothetical protein